MVPTLKNQKPAGKDIDTLEQIQFDWSDGKRAASLRLVRDAIQTKINGSIHWYQSKRWLKRKLAWCFRVSAILLGAVATALPTVAEIQRNTNSWLSHSGSATILGIAVGALLMLDKFIGASSAWIRFTMAETVLKELLDELVLAYALETSAWAAAGEPSVEQTKHALSTLQGFLSRANQIVHDETNQWKTEFQSALQQIDNVAKAPPKKLEEAVVTIKIVNADRLAGLWLLSIDDGPEEPIEGDSKSLRRTPGPITVRVKAALKIGAAADQTKPFATELADNLEVGVPKTIPISLPLD